MVPDAAQILLISNGSGDLEGLRALLGADLRHVRFVATPEEGVDLLGSESPAIVVCDLDAAATSPVAQGERVDFANGDARTEGLDTLRQIRVDWPDAAIVLLLRDLDGAFEHAARAAGAFDVLSYDEAERGLLRHTLGFAEKMASIERARRNAEADVRAKSAFLAKMSHEIRTPMSGVIGMTELLLDTPLSTSQREFVQAISNSGDALLRIINDILDLSKIEAGKVELERTRFDLHQLAQETAELFAARADGNKVQMVCWVEPGTPQMLYGDPYRLRQVLTNLLGNAVKFTEEGEVVLRVSVSAVNGHQVRVRFSIRDTGVGIDPETLATLFQEFSQADKGVARRFGGTGLGLSISRQLVSLMGGTITVRSGPRRGSDFSFTAVFENDAETAQSDGGASAPPLLLGTHALVVDRSSTVRAHLREQLELLGAHVSEDATAVPALRRIERGDRVDLVILEQDLPDVPGLAVASAMRSAAHGAQMRLLLLTGMSQRFLREKAEAAGFLGCLAKPVRPSDLLNALRGVPDSDPGSAATDALANAGDGAPGEPPAPLNGRILLAEDNPTNQTVARLLLEKLGFEVDVVHAGAAAVRAVGRRLYDAVLMDLQLSDMDGRDATAQIRQMGGRIAATPIIALTANVLDQTREECLAAGMDDYVAKPIRKATLQRVLSRWIAMEAPAPELHTPATFEGGGSLSDTVLETLAQLQSDLTAEEYSQLVSEFCENLPGVLENLRLAVQRQDASEVERLAHQLKGATGVFGARRLIRASTKLEESAQEGNLESAEQLARLLMFEGLKLREGLRKALQPREERGARRRVDDRPMSAYSGPGPKNR